MKAAEAEATLLQKLRCDAEANCDLLSHGAYAQYLSDLGHVEEAQGEFVKALKSVADPPATPTDMCRAYAHYSAGFATLCEATGQLERAERLYQTGLAAYPECPMCLGNYPRLLQSCNRSVDDIDDAYARALNIHPRMTSVMLKYSAFLRHKRKSLDRAERLLEQAVEYEPRHGDALSAFAVFLHSVRPDDGKIQILYSRAEEADPLSVNNLSNFGLYYSEIAHDYDQAKCKFERALQIDPTHANSCYNYAVLLESGFKDISGAVCMYERAIKAQPNHAYALYNLAVLYEEKLHDFGPAEKLYRAAVEATPKDILTNADLGRFLVRRQIQKGTPNGIGTPNFKEAESYLRAALEIDNDCATAKAALGEIALFRGDVSQARNYLASARMIDSNNAAVKTLEAALSVGQKCESHFHTSKTYSYVK